MVLFHCLCLPPYVILSSCLSSFYETFGHVDLSSSVCSGTQWRHVVVVFSRTAGFYFFDRKICDKTAQLAAD